MSCCCPEIVGCSLLGNEGYKWKWHLSTFWALSCHNVDAADCWRHTGCNKAVTEATSSKTGENLISHPEVGSITARDLARHLLLQRKAIPVVQRSGCVRSSTWTQNRTEKYRRKSNLRSLLPQVKFENYPAENFLVATTDNISSFKKTGTEMSTGDDQY